MRNMTRLSALALVCVALQTSACERTTHTASGIIGGQSSSRHPGSGVHLRCAPVRLR